MQQSLNRLFQQRGLTWALSQRQALLSLYTGMGIPMAK